MKQQINKNYITCDECGGKMLTNIADQDSRGNIFCSKCGLIYNPNHPMGHGLTGLVEYMNHNGLQDSVDSIKIVNNIQGLREARITVSKL